MQCHTLSSAGSMPISSKDVVAWGIRLMPTPNSSIADAFEYFTADAVLVQEKRGGQSSDTRTDDDRFHVPSVVIALATGRVGTSSLGRPSDTMRGELTVGKSRWL